MKFKEVLSRVLLPEIINKIIEEEKIDDISAIYKFYFSKTYDLLSKEKTKLWLLSSLEIYDMYKREVNT